MPENLCPTCGDPIPTQAPGGNCPRCLLRRGLESDPSGSDDRTVELSERPASALETIAATVGALPRVMLRDTEVGEEPSPIIRPNSGNDTSTRYRIDGEIARGGMGAVLKGRDPDLGRDVAIKVLREDLRDKGDFIRRFVEEAQIGGQLQHPGVVPIYELGTFADKRPFFCMKLVKGKTLADLLASRATPRDELPRFLSIFEAMAQTMAYAHTRGVIHRDLKPSNVMVGGFGEVQVMDWGLAKVLARGGVADDARAGKENPPETMIATARSGSDGDLSRAGSILGTPSYMAPEQARGEGDQINERADVFSLGSILCEILTGSPAFTGYSSREIIRKASRGDTAAALAKLDSTGIEDELVALAKDCLAVEQADRPRDANTVSDRITAYLAGVQERARTAERERAVAVARAVEERKRRKVQLALAASLAGLMLCGGTLAWWRAEQAQAGRERAARDAEAAAGLLSQCDEALRTGDTAKAALLLEAARKRSAEGGATKEAERLSKLNADLALSRDLDAVDQFRWTWMGDAFPDVRVVATRTRKALARFGADPDSVSADEAESRVSLSAVKERIVSALDRLVRYEKSAGARALLRRVDADPFRDAVRDAVLTLDRTKVAELAASAAAFEQPAEFVAFLGESPVVGVERRRRLLETALLRRPGNLSLLMTLGGTYPAATSEIPRRPAPANSGDGRADVDERLRWYQAAAAAAPDHVGAINNLGTALSAKGRVDEAILCYKKAIELDPKQAQAHNNLGLSLEEKGRVDEAVGFLKKAIELDPKYAQAHNNLGTVLRRKGQSDEAVALYHKAIELEPRYATPYVNLGFEMRAKGQVNASLEYYKKAVELDPNSIEANHGLAELLREAGRVDEAVAYCKKAVELNPKDAEAHSNLGILLRAIDRVDEAIACYEKAIELDPKFAPAHINLGNLLKAKGQVDESIACYEKAVSLEPKFALAHSNLGNAYMLKQEIDKAVLAYRKAVELDPKSAKFREQLAVAQRLKAAADKLPAYRKGDYKPATTDERLALAQLCLGMKLHHTAAGLYAAAFEADPKVANDMRTQPRYNAACHAALAAAGQGSDADKLDDAERTRLRKQALEWLRAELAAWGKLLDSGPPQARPAIGKTLSHWRQDPDLAAVRDASALAKLPETERKEWAAFWTEVDQVSAKAAK